MEDRETVVTVLQRVVALPVVLLVVLSTAMDHGTEALEEVTRHHAFLMMVVISLAVDRDGGYALTDFANPFVEQMARHWFASHFANPSVETFAHPFVSLLMCRLEAWRTGRSWTPVVRTI